MMSAAIANDGADTWNRSPSRQGWGSTARLIGMELLTDRHTRRDYHLFLVSGTVARAVLGSAAVGRSPTAARPARSVRPNDDFRTGDPS
jgi:hypothetical protein